MNRKKQQQQVEEAPVDKMDLFLANNYKKLLIGIAGILVIFIAGYAFKSMSDSKSELMVNKVGQIEMLLTLSGGAESQVEQYTAMANEYSDLSDYINLKTGQVLSMNGKDGADKVLANVGGDFKELADGLKFDIGVSGVNPEEYLNSGKMTALWYYRAYLAADDSKKNEIMEAFKAKFPENALYKQIERWNG